VKISAEVMAAIEAHARQTAPEECCGLLIGTPFLISAAVQTRNAAAEPLRRYEIDARDHFAAIRQARGRSLDVIGAYHSHPRSAPVPSETDRQEAFANFVFVIVGLAGLAAEIRAWRLESGNFTEVSLVAFP
jgi:proteasome lid subunit RPN8/RPN11